MGPHSTGVLLGGMFAGGICGLAPLVVGSRRHRSGLGATGFVTCLLSGSVLGILLAAPVAVLWTLLLLRKRRRRRTWY